MNDLFDYFIAGVVIPVMALVLAFAVAIIIVRVLL